MSKKQQPLNAQNIGTEAGEKPRKVDIRCERCKMQPAMLPGCYCRECAEYVANVTHWIDVANAIDDALEALDL